MSNLSRMLILSILYVNGLSCAKEVFVSPDGSDSNVGTIESPFASIERARDALRAAAAEKSNAAWLRAGRYFLSETIHLDSQDSGTSGSPRVFSAYQGESVRLIGAKALSPEWFRPSGEDSAAWKRLPESARGSVVEVDLRKRGIEDYGELRPRGHSAYAPAGMELFVNTKPMRLARWPNEGFVRTVAAPMGRNGQKFTYAGSRPERWTEAQDPWISGYFRHDYADSTVSIFKIDTEEKTIFVHPNPSHGIAEGARYFALNLLEELDAPGEWYLDREAGILYFWPPEPLAGAEILVSVIDDELLNLNRVSHLLLRSLTIEAGRGNGIAVQGGVGVRLEDCALRNQGDRAVTILRGADHSLERCEIVGSGAGGIYLRGEDRASLAPTRFSVQNCHIHDYARFHRTASEGIYVHADTVGVRIAHNRIHDAPRAAIMFQGNDHTIEYNEIFRVCTETSDAGAVYTGHDWCARGNVFRYNFVHDIQIDPSLSPGEGVQGLYLDDCHSGQTVQGNIFYRIATDGVRLAGGRDNTIVSNLFVECGHAIQFSDRRHRDAEFWKTMRENLEKCPYASPPWSARYPKLASILQGGFAQAQNPNGNLIARNVGQANGEWVKAPADLLPLLEQRDNLQDVDPRFVDRDRLDMRLRSDSPAFGIPGFQSIPFEKIGIQQSLDRGDDSLRPPSNPRAQNAATRARNSKP